MTDMKSSFRFVVVLSLLMVPCSLWAALDRPSPTAPGKYSHWGGQIEKLEIVAPFKLADYSRIVVEPLDTSSTPLPKEGDSNYAPVKDVLSQASPAIAAALSKQLPNIPVNVETPGASPDSGALVVRGKVLTMEPGSQSPRYAANGSGRTRTVVAGEVVDGNTGKTLLRFQQERNFGASGPTVVNNRDVTDDMSVRFVEKSPARSGSASEKAMGRNLYLIGGDLADILKSF
jgi:hypothetical protein